jgi:hypothetical protein
METHPLLELALSIGPTVAKPVVKTVYSYARKLSEYAAEPIEFKRSPREIIRDSGLLSASELSLGGIDKHRAMHVINLANDGPPRDIAEIGDPALRKAAIALESPDCTYSRFAKEWLDSPESAVKLLYGSRVVNLYIRKTWPGNAVFEGAMLVGNDY